MAKSLPPPLLYADSASNADQLYFGGVFVPDPFISFSTGSKSVAVVNALEFGRVKRTSNFDLVLPLEDWMQKAREVFPKASVGTAEVILLLAKHFKLQAFTIPADFPAGLAFKLKDGGLRLEVAAGLIFPEREFKNKKEIAALLAGNAASAAGIAAAEAVLREAVIKGGKLLYRGSELTSERVKLAIEIACLEAGAVSLNTIVAGGDQACDPHDTGSGPLRPNELIIVDVFPRVTSTGFHGDMTRTFLKGRASEAQRKLVEAVRRAQMSALSSITAGAMGTDVHNRVIRSFESDGYKTKRKAKGSVGFFHGTGHGLGLAVHELPRITGVVNHELKTGAVVTVEPGLYYPGLGGCRVEDVVMVTPRRPRFLSNYHYNWEIA